MSRRSTKLEKKLARVCAMAMTAVLIFTGLDMTVFAFSDSNIPEERLMTEQGVRYESIAINSASLNGNAIRGVNEGANDAAMDSWGYFYSSSINSSGGLSNDGKLTMDSGISYTLVAGEKKDTAYDGNDCIRLTAGSTSQTMDLETLGVYQKIYVLATAGGPGTGNYADFKVTLTYTDGTTADTTYKLYDWYDTTDVTNVEKYYSIMRMQRGTSRTDGSLEGGPVLHSAAIEVDSTKLLKQITFTMNGKNGNASNMSGLYCCIFAVTGATPAGVPEAPVATAATKVEDSTNGEFTANWDAVEGATGYRLDVATDRKFTQILSDYNNLNVENVQKYTVSGTGINADTVYYYRVRAVNDKGQSLSSNRVSTDVPIWIKNALKDEDQDKVEYDAETNKVTFKEDVTLKDTIVLPESDKTVLDLGGKNITAPVGKPAISAGSGSDVELSIISTDGNTGGSTEEPGSILGSTDSSGNGVPVIDFSNAAGSSAIELSASNVTGSSGNSSASGNGGNGGAGIVAGSNTQIEVGGGATVVGGDGGNVGEDSSGNGGDGGAGISGGNVTVSPDGNVTGGNGGDAVNGNGGNGGAGVSGSNVNNNGTVAGGDGGNGSSAGGSGGEAGAENGTKGTDGVTCVHVWKYFGDGNQVYAWCEQTTSGACDYRGTSDNHPNAKKVSLDAQSVTYSGVPYQGASIHDDITAVTGASLSDIAYYSSTGEGSTDISGDKLPSSPTNVGNYVAVCTITPAASDAGSIEIKTPFKITQAVISEENVSLSSDMIAFSGSAQGPSVTVVVGNNTLEKDRDFTLSGDVVATNLGDSYKIVINGKGNYTGTVEKTWKIVDRSAPTGTIEIAGNQWNSLLGGITFDIFYKNKQTVTITGADEGSGLDRIYYYVSNMALTPSAVGALEDNQWTEGTTINIDSDNRYVVYAKIADKSGNVTYISSDGVVLDATKPVISGVTDGKIYCDEQTITVTDGNLDKVFVNGEEVTLADSTYTLTADGTTYVVRAVDKAGNEDSVTVTVNDGHTPEIDAAVAVTCTGDGLTEGSHCAVCGELLVAQEVVPALGHDWSGEWTVTKEATTTEGGKEETTCTRGCGQKKVRTISAVGTTDELPESVTGTLEKDVEVAKEAPITAATIDNQKKELFDASAIFTDDERQSIKDGSEARVWLEIGKTDESSISAEDKAKLTEEAQKIMGPNLSLIYFDAELFKQVEGSTATQLHEPGIFVKVTIQIPIDLLNQDKTIERQYKIIRLHTDAATGESQVDVLDGTFDEATGEFSFETDRFSTFVITYADTQHVTGVTLDKSEATLTTKGESVQLTATVAPENATNKNVTWTTSDANVATVDANGKVTAVANGTCIITVTTADGSKTATCTIKVNIPSQDNTNNDVNTDNSADKTDDNTSTVTAAPKTGDNSNPALWLLLMLLSMTVLAEAVVRRKRNR
ncbi:MAG: Ig-like domain-containing protein [Roseburia sp.]